MAKVSKEDILMRLKSAANAAAQLEDDIRWLVACRAWEHLGYANFSEMWEAVNGFEHPFTVRAMVVYAFVDLFGVKNGYNYGNGCVWYDKRRDYYTGSFDYEGVTHRTKHYPTREAAQKALAEKLHAVRGDPADDDRVSITDIAKALGYKGNSAASKAGVIVEQALNGVPVDRARSDLKTMRQNILEYGNPQTKRQMRYAGKGPEDLVSTSASVPRWADDEIKRMASEEGVSTSTLYRRIVLNWLSAQNAAKPTAERKSQTHRKS